VEGMNATMAMSAAMTAPSLVMDILLVTPTAQVRSLNGSTFEEAE
jgi:hypothetical protein